MEINEEKRKKFMEYAEKRVNNVMHDITILEPMARSNAYDFTKDDVEAMFGAMQKTLDNVKIEYEKKFEMKARSEKKAFSFNSAEEIPVEIQEIPESKEILTFEKDLEQDTMDTEVIGYEEVERNDAIDIS